MTDDTTTEETLTIVAVPATHAQAVVDFVTGLRTEEADVSGHMLSRGLVSGMSRGPLSVKSTRTDTGCERTTTGEETDFACTDADTVTA